MITLVAILLAVFVLPSPWGVVAVVAGGIVDIAESLLFLWWSRRRRAAVGADALVGRRGTALEPLAPRGQVKVDGEIWHARTSATVARGGAVVVVAVDGITLVVEPAL